MSTTTAWTARYRDALTNRLGLEVEQLESGSLLVDHGLRFVISNYAENDPEFLEVSASFALEGPLDEVVERLAVAVTRKVKAAVVLPTDHGILVSAGFPVAGSNCLPDPAHLAAVVPRVFSMISHASREFHTAHALHGIERSLDDAA